MNRNRTTTLRPHVGPETTYEMLNLVLMFDKTKAEILFGTHWGYILWRQTFWKRHLNVNESWNVSSLTEEFICWGSPGAVFPYPCCSRLLCISLCSHSVKHWEFWPPSWSPPAWTACWAVASSQQPAHPCCHPAGHSGKVQRCQSCPGEVFWDAQLFDQK